MCSEEITHLDLCGETCPTNFVKTLLALEELDPGELLEVTIQGQEALSNVPRSLKQAGSYHYPRRAAKRGTAATDGQESVMVETSRRNVSTR